MHSYCTTPAVGSCDTRKPKNYSVFGISPVKRLGCQPPCSLFRILLSSNHLQEKLENVIKRLVAFGVVVCIHGSPMLRERGGPGTSHSQAMPDGHGLLNSTSKDVNKTVAGSNKGRKVNSPQLSFHCCSGLRAAPHLPHEGAARKIRSRNGSEPNLIAWSQ